MTPTQLAAFLKVRTPILQAPMGRSAPPALAAAVSNAGGLGMLGCSWDNPEQMQHKIRETRRLTSAPFAVNLCMEWDQAERLELALAEGVKHISLFWGSPRPLIEKIKAAGAIVLHTVGNANEAREALELDVDILVAQGVEAGGHVRSRVALSVLVPRICDVVASYKRAVPVIAAGGMADGRGMAAAIALGASGIWLGTRFLATPEAGAHDLYKQALIDASEEDTVYTKLFDGGWPDAPHRVLRNSTVRAWQAAGEPASGQRPGEDEILTHHKSGASFPRYDDAAPMQGLTGDVEAMALYAGQSVGLVHDIQPVASLMKELVVQANLRLPTGLQFPASV